MNVQIELSDKSSCYIPKQKVMDRIWEEVGGELLKHITHMYVIGMQ